MNNKKKIRRARMCKCNPPGLFGFLSIYLSLFTSMALSYSDNFMRIYSLCVFVLLAVCLLQSCDKESLLFLFFCTLQINFLSFYFLITVALYKTSLSQSSGAMHKNRWQWQTQWDTQTKTEKNTKLKLYFNEMVRAEKTKI